MSPMSSDRRRRILLLAYLAILAGLAAALVWGITNCGCNH